MSREQLFPTQLTVDHRPLTVDSHRSLEHVLLYRALLR